MCYNALVVHNGATSDDACHDQPLVLVNKTTDMQSNSYRSCLVTVTYMMVETYCVSQI